MKQTLCDRCGAVMQEVENTSKIRRIYLNKRKMFLQLVDGPYGWEEDYLEFCDDCRRDFDKWLKEKERNPCQS